MVASCLPSMKGLRSGTTITRLPIRTRVVNAESHDMVATTSQTGWFSSAGYLSPP